MSVMGWVRERAERLFGGSSRESMRFRVLDAFDALYRGRQYEGRGLADPWDKTPPGRKPVPLRMQRPSVQYDLPRVIVDRPTALLFGEGRFPELVLEPAEEGADVEPVNAWLAAIADEGDLQHVALCGARLGGATGAVAYTWGLVEGEFVFEAHAAKHCTPTFKPRRRRRLEQLEKRYKFEKEERTADGVKKVDYWHREIWNEQAHVIYEDIPVPKDGKDPENWPIAETVEHGFGLCPAAWVKNLDDADASTIDGFSILDGQEDVVEDIDRTLTQKSRAIRYNQDPERVFLGVPIDPETGKPFQVGTGIAGGNAPPTSLPAGADAKLLELSGDGQRAAEEHITAQRDRALEVARVVSPSPERLVAAAKSGVALRILHAPMLELVGELRQTYGRALRELLEQILRLAREGKLEALGTLTTPQPAEGIPPGKIALVWGDVFEPTPEDLEIIARAAAALKAGGVLDEETIVRFVGPYFGVRNVENVLAKLEEQQAREYGEMMQRPTKPGEPGKKPPSKSEAAGS